jgi:hypothetical protein
LLIRVEVRRVLRGKFAWPDDDIADALFDLDECTTLFHPTQTLSVISDDARMRHGVQFGLHRER